MKQVERVKDLEKTVKLFTSKDAVDCIESAEKWAKKNGVVLSNYYIQMTFKGRSILVGIEKP